ncbi:uncharacterized protein [Venturia canescens]|uniref:uncharacterized protein isoform X2 n=1 Tax=Venturia canescens TaxID=32260 RepID=UPI001C9D30C3|nr:uncharacterized protein LOC122408647 isoform X2 [Venturia canescens]
MMDFSEFTFRTAMVVAFFVLTTVSVVQGEIPCKGDDDCPSNKYCYNVSNTCVNHTQCSRYNRARGPRPAQDPSQCGPCLPGYAAELKFTGVWDPVCLKTTTSKENETESTRGLDWPRYWVAIAVLAAIFFTLVIAFVLRKHVCIANRDRICNKMISWSVRPTAPPQDEASFRLRHKTYPVDEERPPIYSSVIGPNVDKNHLVSATPFGTALWVNKPPYEFDFNDNVSDGVAMPIHSSSNNSQMDLEEEEETNPSSWTPGQMTVEVPSRPFARFGVEQQENVINNVLIRENCASHSTQEDSGSDEAGGVHEESSSSRSQGNTFCGPNVQINQTITLNIGKNSTK